MATTYESDHPFEARMTGEGKWLMARNKVVEPLGDYKSDYEFWLDLACRMGYGDDFWNGDIEACMDWQLQNLGITMKELRKHPTGMIYKPNPPQFEKFAQTFATPSLRFSRDPYLPQGKVALYNTTFEENGFNPLPEWVEPPESPTGTPELLGEVSPDLFDTHTSDVYNHGWCHNVPCLREMHPDPGSISIPAPPGPAGSRRVTGWLLSRPMGRSRYGLHFPGIPPDIVMGLHGWWQSCDELGLPGQALLDGGANANLLYSIDPDKAFDPVVSAMAKQTLVELRRVDGRRRNSRRQGRLDAAEGDNTRRCVAVGRHVDPRASGRPRSRPGRLPLRREPLRRVPHL